MLNVLCSHQETYMADRYTKNEYRLDILNDCAEPEQFRMELELFFTLDGALSVTVDGISAELTQGGVIIVNPGHRRSFSADKKTMAFRVAIPFSVIRRFVPQQNPVFWCNTTQDDREEYEYLRTVIRQFLDAHLRSPDHPGPLAISLFYELLDCLCRCFLVDMADDQTDDDGVASRITEITAFVEENYSQHISLNDLAEHLHLTYSYLSRYLKKSLGINFLDYLTQVRIRHAVEDILYTDKSMTHVAVDNGFVNSPAFNKAFKECYGITPTAYREKMRGGSSADRKDSGDLEKLYRQARRILEAQAAEAPKRGLLARQKVCADGAVKQPYHKNWEDMINIGRASDLLKAKVQEQTLYLRDRLGFRYVRFWSIFDADMELRAGHDTSNLSFDKIDEVLDFLVQNNLSPFIDLGDKPIIILKTIMEFTKVDEGEPIFGNIPEFQSVVTQFFNHIVTRYRTENVRNWRFECWYDDRYHRQSEPVSYYDIFNTVSKIARDILPDVVIGGCGMKISDKNMEKFLCDWMEQPYKPDFFSVQCYPYEETDRFNKYSGFTKISEDPEFLTNNLKRIRAMMDRAGISIPIYVTEWNNTLSSSNYINDSCYKGCYLLKNIIGSVDLAEMIGYWAGSDLINAYFDAPNVINGRPGLLSKDGICKPSFYAYRFLHRAEQYLVSSGKNYLITASDHFSYYIVCFNSQNISTQYYRQKEDSHTPDNLRVYLDKLMPARMSFCLKNLPEQNFTVKTSVISPQYGSIMDEWIRLNQLTNMRREDIDYLKRICTPHMFIRDLHAQDGSITLDVDLDGEEIALIHIFPAR